MMRRTLAKLVLPVVLKPKSVFTTCLELFGFAAVTVGVARIDLNAGVIIGGLLLVLVGILA
jgi:hypothetical protein